MRLTTRGWIFLGSGAGLYAGGRALGVAELSMLAAGALAAVAVSAVVAMTGRPEVTVIRTLHPARLHAGTTAYAELIVTNAGSRRTRVLAVSDRFTGRREARFAVAPLDPGQSARGAFRIPTNRRGVYRMGPLTVSVTDPLGLVIRVQRRESSQEVTVFPHVEVVPPLPPAAGRDLVGGSVDEFTRSRSGEEFHALREYQVGDDLRRVHWRSTARTGELMIREHDLPWQTRATLVLDDRRRSTDGHTFEKMVEATASVAASLLRSRALTRLLTVEGGETGFGSGHEHQDAVLEQLAVVERRSADHLAPLVARLHRQAGAGALVVFTSDLDDEQAKMLATLERRFTLVTIIQFTSESGDVDQAPNVPGAVTIEIPAGARFSDHWNRTVIGSLTSPAR